MKKTLVYIFSALLLTGCLYPFKADVDITVEKHLVVDANILLGSQSYVRLQYLQPLEPGQRISGSLYPSGTVYLQDESGKTYPARGNNGHYYLDVPETVQGKMKLTVVVDGKTYVSEWVEAVAPPVIKDASFMADETYVHVLLDMEDEGSGSGYAALQYDEIWYFHTDYIRRFDYNEETNSVVELMAGIEYVYWCWFKKQNLDQKLIDYTHLNGNVQDYVAVTFPRNDNRNHSEYNVRIKLWNLTPEQYRYRKMLEENASIGGNLFSPEPGEVRGNIHCEEDPEVPVFGYVNVARVTMIDKTLPGTYSTWRPKYKLLEVAQEDWPYYYQKGYMPVEETISTTGNGTVVGWGEARCWNCEAAGGTLYKPTFD